MNSLNQIVLCVISIVGLSLASVGRAQSELNKIKVSPDLTYRQASLEKREDSVFHRDTHRNYVDQLYLSLKLVRKFGVLDEIVIEPAVRTVRENPSATPEVVIDQAYVLGQMGPIDLAAGKRAESYGSGYFFSPSDLLNEDKDLFDPLYQREGKVFTRLTYTQTDAFSLGLAFVPKVAQDARDGRAWLLLQSNILNVDTIVQATYNREERATYGLSMARVFGDHLELHSDARFQSKQRGIDAEPERRIFDCAVVDTIPEDIRQDEDPSQTLHCLEPSYAADDPSMSAVLGGRIIFSARRTLAFEGIYRQSGLDEDEMSSYFLFVKKSAEAEQAVINPEPRLMGRRYAFASYLDEETIQSLKINFSFLYSLQDESMFLVQELRYTLSPIVNIAIAPTFFVGDAESEFGEMPFKAAYYLTVQGRF